MAPLRRKSAKLGARATTSARRVKRPKQTIPSSGPGPQNAARTDMILAINDPYMQQIIDGTKTHEFRKYDMAGIQRMWFYRTAPHSAITHVCEVEPAVTRGPGCATLPEDGIGNREYNEKHAEWEGYEFAFRITSVYAVNAPAGIPWTDMRDKHGMKAPPRGRVSLPQTIQEQFKWDQQTKIR